MRCLRYHESPTRLQPPRRQTLTSPGIDEPARARRDDRDQSRLAVEATTGVTDLVEAMHHHRRRPRGPRASPLEGPAKALERRWSTERIRGSHQARRREQSTSRSLDSRRSSVKARRAPSGKRCSPRSTACSAITSPSRAQGSLALRDARLRPRRRGSGRPRSAALARELPRASGKIVLLIHGSSMNDRQWSRLGHDHGAALAGELGYTPIYVRYNSRPPHLDQRSRARRACSNSFALGTGRLSSRRSSIIGHSMGGLVARSACHAADAGGLVAKDVDEPSLLGNAASRRRPRARRDILVDCACSGRSGATALRSRALAKIRSAGVTDLRF